MPAIFGGVVAVAVRLYARMLAGAADRGVVDPTTAAGVLGGGCGYLIGAPSAGISSSTGLAKCE